MTATAAPREDQLQLPAAWTARLLPRRGRRPGKPVVLDPAAPAKRRMKIAARADRLRTALDLPGNADYAAPALAFLDGEPDPLGAAVISALMLGDENVDRRTTTVLRPDLDLWVQEYGPTFAIAAAVERLPLYASTHQHHATGALAERIVRPYAPDYPYLLRNELGNGGVAALRTLVAGLTDAEYEAARTAVADHRGTPETRIAATVLFPDETEWGLEAAADYGNARSHGWADGLLLQSLSDPSQLTTAGIADLNNYYTDATALAALVDGVGAAALPLLAATLDAPGLTNELRKLLLRAVSLLPADEAAAYLLGHLDRPHYFEPASEAAARFPVRTLRAALSLAETASAAARPLVTAVAATADPLGREHLTDAEREALDALLAETVSVPEADAAELPPLLVAPPWTVKRPKAKPVVIPDLQPPAEARLTWFEGEQQEWAEIRDLYGYDEAHWVRAFESESVKPDDWRYSHYLAFGPLEKAEPLLDAWGGVGGYGWDYVNQRILARFGERVIDRVVTPAMKDASNRPLPGPVLNATAARLSAERLARLKSARQAAAEWFERHGLDAVPYLVPDALGSAKKPRQYAEVALAHLAVHHGAEAVVARAESFGPEAAAAIAAVVDGDPLEPRGVQIPKIGAWASPVMLPQVLLKGGERAVPAASIPHLVTVLALATPDYPYPGLDVVAEACDRDSLTRFGKAVFDRWLAVGAPPKDGWALTQLAHFPDDETVWSLAPKVRQWPGESQHKRAVAGLEVLGAIGTEEALRAIQGIAEKVKFKALKEEARVQIEGIAAGLGLTREQLADRLVPDFGLGDAATLVLDYGPRRFTVAFDEHLKPFVVDDTGKARKALPKPGAKDDPAIAEAAYKRFSALKKELRSVAADQVVRLEAAMVAARSWSVEEFRRFFAEHPLTRHLARRLVWLAEDGETRFGFRIAEDGTFSDVEDDELDLPADATIRVAHPVHMEPKAIDAWAEVLADYEILQPFDQLSRPVLAFTEEELDTGHLARFEGVTVDVGRILGMTKRGWRRATPEDAGMEPGISYELPGGGYVAVQLDPGIAVGMVAEFPEQRLESVRLSDRELYYRYRKDGESWRRKEIDPVTASEVLAALTRLTEQA